MMWIVYAPCRGAANGSGSGFLSPFQGLVSIHPVPGVARFALTPGYLLATLWVAWFL